MSKRLLKLALVFSCVLLVLLALVPGMSVQADFGTNWTAQYFNNPTLSGSPVATQSGIPGINFNWGLGSPISGTVPNDQFSARFTSTQTFTQGTYQFVASSDDGIRVYIDNTLALDRFIGRPLTTDTFNVTLTAGAHNLTVEYFEGIDQAIVQFQWFLVSGGTTPGVPTTPGGPTAIPSPAGPQASLTFVRGLAVRTGPYMGASFVTTIGRETAVTVLARNRDEGVYNWYLVQVNGKQGWASGRYLQVTGVDPNTLPVQGTVFEQIDGAPDIGVVAIPRAVMNLRRRPSARAQIIGQIPWGGEASLIGRTVQGGKNFWLQVRYEGVVGWIYAPFVSIRGEINAVPIR